MRWDWTTYLESSVDRCLERFPDRCDDRSQKGIKLLKRYKPWDCDLYTRVDVGVALLRNEV
jgi:hypothetical protein